MSSIDERIVQMQFDNKQFESGVKTTIDSLDKLKSSLKLDGASKGLDGIDKSVKGLNLNPLISSVETVSERFTTLGVIGTTALINITNKAIDAGEKLVKSLSIDQIANGWSKYADKTAAVQTIMAATRDTWEDSAKALEFEGTQMEFVNSQLDKLNWFTDETSYNFLDMVNNIGKFTNNGVPLQDAVTSMEGISTWAALSGANIAEAGRAMYNFSQAMGAGSMKLQDWKSIENANMATMEFKQTAIETAIELGKLTEAEEGFYKATEPIRGKGTEFNLAQFRDGLKDAWFDTEVMTKSLEKFGNFAIELNNFLNTDGISDYYYTTNRLLDDLDKFKTSDVAGQMAILEKASQGTGKSVDELREKFEYLNSGKFELSKRAFKAAQEAKTFAEAIDSVKDAVSTGWMNTFEKIFGNYEEAKILWTDLANSLYEVFAEGGNMRNDLLNVWRDLDGRKALLEGVASLLKSILRLAEPISQAFSETFKVGSEYVTRMGWNLTVAVARFREFAKSIWLTDEAHANLTKTFKGFFTVIKWVIGGFKTIASILSVFLQPLNVLADVIFTITGRIGDMITGADEVASRSKTLRDFIDGVREKAQILANILTFLIKVVGLLALAFLDWVESSGVVRTVLENLRGAVYILVAAFQMALVIAAKFILKIGEVAEKVIPKVRNTFERLWESMVNAFPFLGEIKDKIVNFVKSLSNIKAPSEIFTKLQSKITKMGAKVNPVLEKVGSTIWNLLKTIKNFTVTNAPKAFDILAGAFTGLGKVVISIGTGMAPVFDAIGKGIGMLVDKIKQLDWAGIAASAQARASVIAGVLTTVASNIWKFIDGFIKAPDKIKYITDAIKKIIDDIKKKIEEITKDKNLEDLENKIRNFVDKINEAFKGLTPAKALLAAFAISLIVAVWKIGTAFEKFGQFADAAKDLFGITSLIKKLTNAIKATTTITQIAASIAIIAASLKTIASIPKEDLMRAGKTLGVVAAALMLMSFALSSKLFNPEAFASNAKSIIYLAGAIGILAAALWILSKTANVDDLLVKAGALALLIAAFGGVAIALNHFAPEFKASAKGIVALAAAVLMLTKALDNISKTMKSDNAEQAVEALIALMVSLGVLAVAAGGVGWGTGFGMMGLVASIMMLDLVLKYLIHFGTKADEALAAIDRLAPVFVALAAVLASTRLAGQNAAKAGVAALLIAGALVLLSYAVDELRQFKLEEISTAGLFLGGMALALAAALHIIGDAGKHAIKASVAIIAITAAVMLLSKCVKSIYEMLSENSEQSLMDKIQAFGMALLAVGALAIAIGAAAKATEKAKTAPILALILAIGTIMAGIALLSVVASENYVAFGAAVIGTFVTLLAMAKVIASTSKASEKANTKPLVAMVIGLGAVLAALVYLTKQPIANVAVSAAAMVAVLLAIGKCAQWANKGQKGAEALKKMAIPLAVAAASLVSISRYGNIDGLIPAAIALAIIMATIAGAAKWASGAEKAAEAMKYMAIPLAVAAAGLWALKDSDPRKVLPAAVAMGLVIVAIAGCTRFAKPAIQAAESMVIMSASLVVAAAAFKIMDTIDTDKLIATGIALGSAMAAFAALSAFAADPEIAAAMHAAGLAMIEYAASLDMIALAAVGFAAAVYIIVAAFERLGNMSTEQVDRATEAIERFGTAIGVGLANIIIGFASTIYDAVQTLLGNIVDWIGEHVPNFIKSGYNMVKGLVDGFLSGDKNFFDVVWDAVSKAIVGLLEFPGKFYDEGVEFVTKLVEGVMEHPDAVAKGIGELVDAAIAAARSLRGKFEELGAYLAEGLAAGVTAPGPFGMAQKAGAAIGNALAGAIAGALKENSPSKVTMQIGQYAGIGLANGVKNTTKDAYDAGYKAGKAVEKGYKDGTKSFTSGRITPGGSRAFLGLFDDEKAKKKAKDEAKKWVKETVGEDTYKDLQKTRDQVYKGLDQFSKGDFSGFTDAVNTGAQGLNNLDNAFTGAFGKLGQGDISGAVQELGNAFFNTGEAAEKASSSTQKASKSYGKVGRAAGGSVGGIEAATEAQARFIDVTEYGKGAIEAYVERYGDTKIALSDTSPTEAAKKAVEALARATYEASLQAKSAAERAKESADDAKSEIEKIEEAYLKLREGVADIIEDQMDMFKTFEFDDKDEKITGKKILEAMQSNKNAADRYVKDMQSMAEKGFAQPLIEKVAELGPKGVKTIEAFLKMSEQQIERANQLYGELVEIPFTGADKVLAGYAYAGQMAIQGYADGIDKGAEVASNKVFDVATQTLYTLESTLDEHSPSKKTYSMGENFSLGFVEGIAGAAQRIYDAVANLGKSAMDKLGILTDKSEAIKIGENICLGIAEGIKSKTYEVVRAAEEMANAVIDATESVLEINSPSRAFERIGEYSDMGFANGLRNYTGLVGSAAEFLGEEALANVEDAIDFIREMMEEGLEDGPSISPVVDLSGIQAGPGSIHLLDPGAAVNAASAIQIQNDNNKLLSAMRDVFSTAMGGNEINGGINFTIYGANGQDPRAIADAVEERLMVKFNRLRAARA